MEKEKIRETYEKYFDEKAKAAAFDKIAEEYYMGNFGAMNKSDFETLLFSIYIEQILEKDEDNMREYSDYTLSKLLGITQTKVSNLKVKKELLYPRKEFDWRKAFERISSRAVYENQKIRLNIPDRNLYLELKNAIEEAGGYVDVQLNRNLLQIRPEYFFDLLLAVADEEDRKNIEKEIKKQLKEKDSLIEYMDREPISKILLKQGPEAALDIIKSCVTEGVLSKFDRVGNIANNIIYAIVNRRA